MNVAFIPVRGGSKSIPLKNIKSICRKPLVFWCIKAAVECKYIDKVYVSTDSSAIKKVVENFHFSKVEVIERSPDTASDTASTESAMLEFADRYKFDDIVLIQATSPLIQSEDLDKGFIAYQDPNVDSVLSAVRQKRFNWLVDENGYAYATNYNIFARPRRQEYDGYLVENGAFYITSRERLISEKNRISGNIRAIEMREESFYEIDEPGDWIIIESLMKRLGMGKETDFSKIKLFLTDCDGCLTDAGMYYAENGDELKKFNTKDGMGFSLLQKAGIYTGIITGENSDLVKRRADKLKLDEVILGCKDKENAIRNLCEKYSVDISQVCYVGDDINDIGALEAVGISCCPSDAVERVKSIVNYVTIAKGGDGVIREIVDLIV